MNADILSKLNRHLAEIYPNSVTRNSKNYPNSVTKRIYARLDFTLIPIDNVINIEADYFGSVIQIEIKLAKSRKHILQSHISITNEYGQLEMDKILNHQNTDSLFNKVVIAINSYVKSRPFIIIRYLPGQHKLLDPNGMDYIGQYVTLKDAKKSSCYNYIR